MEHSSGNPFPLGASWDGKGVNFAIYAANAEAVELCFFSQDDDAETARIRLTERTRHVWHAYVSEIGPGQCYGYRIYGAYKPGEGQRYNSNKLLIDPYAKAISGKVNWHDSLFGYELTKDDLVMSEVDSAPFMPKSVVIDSSYDWEGVQPPRSHYNESVIYEAHVKGLTKLHPEIPEQIRGTYAAIAHPAITGHLKQLGVTAIELMPVHQFINDRHLEERGLSNYWGYNTIGFFAPNSRYSSSGIHGQQVREFKDMVKALHREGIEVILDVVYNHTAEGNHQGPTLSFKGVDNESYYRLTEDKRFYMDYTGTGNTLNANSPNVLRMIMDSLRYWILEMHVDGFRFDLASTLARGLNEVNMLGAFFSIIHQDPVISQVKLIAEPWDIGEGGYQVGNFPSGWAEWNGKYRDCIRDYWRGEERMLGEFASRLTGSPDLYQDNDRSPTASINFITAHDGFTMHDLVSYNQKNNEANGEDNQDGEEHNRSSNYGAEGDTEDAGINALRSRQKRNFLTTLFLSQGVPMLVAGDELGRTQKGNNNAYCQDNELSWLHWDQADQELLTFTRRLIKLRADHPVLRRRKWFKGEPLKDKGVPDIAWFLPEGSEMEAHNWEEDFAKSLAVFLQAEGTAFYILFNAHHEGVMFRMPPAQFGADWELVLDTGLNELQESYQPEAEMVVEGRTVMVLKTK
ncbi:glycogen debranching protein GlgX [Pedobacter sp. GR22-6]|uniref:glycogen debranching protein GlgX n=1 Tax=Pedobacter sp. GR22-6 TaxID=3127957 RepID=UPI00307E2033